MTSQEIKVGSILRGKGMLSMDPVVCTKITQSSVYLQHETPGSIPIVLNFHDLDESNWEIIDFKQLEVNDE